MKPIYLVTLLAVLLVPLSVLQAAAVIALEYDSLVEADPNARGKYHWYTRRSLRHTEIKKGC